MKRTLSTAAVAALMGLTACSVTTPDPAGPASTEPSTKPAPSNGAADPMAGPSPSNASGMGAGGVRAACEEFNSLMADYAAVPAGDADGYEDVYLAAEEAKDTAGGDLRGLFAALSLLAIDQSAAAGSGGEAAQESKDAVRDAVFANAGTCTAEGVTLQL